MSAERKRVITAPSARKKEVLPVEETDDSVSDKQAVKKPIKRPPVKKETVPSEDTLAKELFDIKPTKKFAIEPWQHGAAVGEMDMPSIGIPFPSLCLEMFTGHSVLPVSSCYALAGPTGSFKSHLVVEIARWIVNSGGYVQLAENESKYNQDMARAIIGKNARNMYVYSCSTFNQVQQALIKIVQSCNAEKETPLMLQIIDSIVGNATESSQDKVKKEGEIERGYPPNALAAANFLPNYMPMLGNKPYLGVWVTHSKEEKVDMYHPTVVTLKGGGSWEYRCRMAFILNRVSEKPKYEDRTWKVALRLSLKKDAAVRGFQLPVNIRCKNIVINDPETGEVYAERKVRFCWHEATLALFESPEKAGYPPFYTEIAKDIIGLAKVRIGNETMFIAPKIGISKDEASKDPAVIMNAIYDNPSILDQMRAEMGIQKGVELNPNISFDTALKTAKTIAARRAKLLQNDANVTYLTREEVNEFD